MAAMASGQYGGSAVVIRLDSQLLAEARQRTAGLLLSSPMNYQRFLTLSRVFGGFCQILDIFLAKPSPGQPSKFKKYHNIMILNINMCWHDFSLTGLIFNNEFNSKGKYALSRRIHHGY
jgi:hypothetical protein